MHSRCHLSIRIWDLLGVLGFKGGREALQRRGMGRDVKERGRVAMGDRKGGGRMRHGRSGGEVA
jgi:hypothetical protein